MRTRDSEALGKETMRASMARMSIGPLTRCLSQLRRSPRIGVMSRLVYAMNVSLDGYVAAPDGSLGWSHIDEEIHGWWNDRIRESAAYLYGRRIYELMAAHWPTADADPNSGPIEREFGRIWTAAPKVVFSSTLESVDWNARLERGRIEDVIDRVRIEFDGDLDVSGPTLAAPMVRRNLIDVY